MTNRALFDCNADGQDRGFIATHSQMVALKLRTPVGVGVWQVQVWDPDGSDPSQPIVGNPPKSSKSATLVDLIGTTTGKLVQASSPSATVTFPAPATGSHSYLVRSIVDGGFTNGKIDPSKVYERMISVVGVSGVRKPVVTEALQFEDDSWAGALSDAVDILDSGGETSGLMLLAANVVATSNRALTGGGTVDGITLVTGMRALLIGQSSPAQNGPWEVNTTGAWQRPADFDENSDVQTGQVILVLGGTTYTGSQWALTSPGPFVLGTTALNWAQIGGAVSSFGGFYKEIVTVLANSNVTQSGLAQVVDGVTCNSSSMRVLCTDQTDPTLNGIWNPNAAGWTRAADFDSSGDIPVGCTGQVQQGTRYGGATWTLENTTAVTLGVTALTFRAATFTEVGPLNAFQVHAVDASGFSGLSSVRMQNAVGALGQTLRWRDVGGIRMLVSEDGGGAVLQNVQAVSLPPQDKLQIAGGKVSDDPTNTRTKVDLHRTTLEEQGASAVAIKTRITTTASSANVTFDPGSGLRKGDWVFAQLIGAAHGMPAPVAPTVVQQGTTGSTTVSVKIAYYSRLHGYSAASSATVITNANATPSHTNPVEIWCNRADARAAGAESVIVYLQFNGSGGTHSYRGCFIANPMNGLGNFEVAASFRLHSTSAVTAPDGISSTAPASATKNGMWLQLTSELDVSNGATVSPVPKSSATLATCWPDAVVPLLNGSVQGAPLDDTSTELVIPPGEYFCATSVAFHRPTRLRGVSNAHGFSSSVLSFRDGAGIEICNRTNALMRQPGEPIRVGDYRTAILHSTQPGAPTSDFVKFKCTAIAGSATWGWTAASGDPSWNWGEGQTTTDGDITWTASENHSTASDFNATGVTFVWRSPPTIPINRTSVPADLQTGSWHEFDSGGVTGATWVAGMVASSANRWIFPTASNATGKIYYASVTGTAGGSEPAWPRTHGATVVDGGITWLCVDAPRQQGCAVRTTCITHFHACSIKGLSSSGIPGSGFGLDGDIYTHGGQCDYATCDLFIVYTTGHLAYAVGSDAHNGSLRFHGGHYLGLSWQDDSFYGNAAYVGNGAGAGPTGQIGFGGALPKTPTGAQNRRNGSVQGHSVLTGYCEGVITQDWNSPGLLGFPAYNLYNTVAGSNPLVNGSYLANVGSYSTDLSIGRIWVGNAEQFGALSGTALAGTLGTEVRDFDTASGGIRTRIKSIDTETIGTTLVYSGRGRIYHHTKGVLLGENTTLFTSIGGNVPPTTGAYLLGDCLRWGFDNRRLEVRPSRNGQLGTVARVNSTTYARGDIYTSSSRAFVVVAAGAVAASPPAGLATANLGDVLTDGNARVVCWGPAQSPLFRSTPLRGESVALAAGNATILIATGTVRTLNTFGADQVITLSASGALPNDEWEFINPNNVAFKTDFVNGGPGAGTFATLPASTPFPGTYGGRMVARMNDAGDWFRVA